MTDSHLWWVCIGFATAVSIGKPSHHSSMGENFAKALVMRRTVCFIAQAARPEKAAIGVQSYARRIATATDFSFLEVLSLLLTSDFRTKCTNNSYCTDEEWKYTTVNFARIVGF